MLPVLQRALRLARPGAGKALLGATALTSAAALLIGSGGVVIYNLVQGDGFRLPAMLGLVTGFAVAGFGADCFGWWRSKETAPQRPPPTRDAWDGKFQNMDSASHHMAKKDH